MVGSLATTVAVIAVAWFGLTMLGGSASPRRAIQVVLGAFILFGAPLIARELAGMMRSTGGATSVSGQVQQTQPPLPPPMPTDFDPYAGAAVPHTGN